MAAPPVESLRSRKRVAAVPRTRQRTRTRAAATAPWTSATWWIAWSFRGKKYRESAETTSETVAIRLLKKRIGETGIGKLVTPDVSRKTFEDLAAGLERDYRNNARRSANRIVGALKHLREFFGMWKALDITRDAVERYKDERLTAGAANATVNRELAALKRMFKLADVPRPTFAMLREDNARKGFFERAQFDAVLAQLRAYWQPVFEVAFITGWRTRSEILTREWKHVDFEHGTLRLEPGETKNGEGRNFPMTTALRATLERQRELTDQVERDTDQVIPWVFHRGGERLKEYRRAWTKASTKAGVAGRIAHDFRRTAVRNLERAGVPRSVAMSVVGHKTEAIYRRYAIVDESMQRDAATKLDKLHEADQGKPARVVKFERKGKGGAKS